jgi:adenylosuccinate synthase
MPSVAVIGMQWGDEGKGKIIDLLSEEASHIARPQGGNNAGHTIVTKGQEYRFHLIPSGVLYPHTQCYIGGGTVLDPKSLLQEIESLLERGILLEKRLFISPYAHVVLPYHVLFDELIEKRLGAQGIGTTKRGIGPCYMDKVGRLGIRMADLISKSSFHKKLDHVLRWKNFELERLYDRKPLQLNEIFEEYNGYAERLAPFVAPVEEKLEEAYRAGGKILFEGAQGTLLDVTFGTYPFVTSSCTLAGGVPSGLGIGPTRVDRVVGVGKAYTTRVGNGPFPTEFSASELALFPDHTASREIGVTTGRKRRMGWLDIPLLRHSIRLNGVSSLALMKLDILDGLDEIKICTGYQIGDSKLKTFPPTIEELGEVRPIYETMKGWKSSTRSMRHYRDLPERAKVYVRKIAELCEVELGLISLGPGREETILLESFFDARIKS